jgi:hypothetical protein
MVDQTSRLDWTTVYTTAGSTKLTYPSIHWWTTRLGTLSALHLGHIAHIQHPWHAAPKSPALVPNMTSRMAAGRHDTTHRQPYTLLCTVLMHLERLNSNARWSE